ncbi:MAG: hypothetical protein ACE10F_02855 [Candidatus Methylomirabilales bacterium]
MKRYMAILAILAALAMPALAWADEQVPYDWSEEETTAIQQFREAPSPAITAPQSDDLSEMEETVGGDSA